MGLTHEEYLRALGENTLLSVVLPTSPTYRLYTPESRVVDFLKWLAIFRAHFVNEEFDRWYLEVARRIQEVPWASSLWNGPESVHAPTFVETHEASFVNPILGRIKMQGRMNRLLADPRFVVLEYTPLDDETRRRIAWLRTLSQFSYPLALPVAARL